MSNHRKVGGLLFPHAFDSNEKGQDAHYALTIEKMELNVPVDDAIFAMPAPKVAP